MRKHWSKSFKKKLDTIIGKNTFSRGEKPPEEPIIPVTAKFRVKLKADGSIDKLKTRVCPRGDKQQELTNYDTWCPIGSFRKAQKATGTSVCREV